MHNHYIINGVVEFHPATSTLRDLNDPHNVVVLNSPAGRCLLLLIERNGTIVTQHEFLEIVWSTRGMLVSSNTFYQNISILRKGLKKIGLAEDLVVTIPRIGLTLASGTHIKKLTTEQQVEVSHENAHFIDEQSLAQELNTLHQCEAVEGRETLMHSEPRDTSSDMSAAPATHPETVSGVSRRGWLIKGIGALAALGLLGAGILAWSSRDDGQYFSHYRFLNTSQGCHIFLSGSIISEEARSKAMARGHQFADGCKSYPWVYVSHLPLLPRTSVIRCDKPMSEPNTCISDYFFEDK